MKFLESQQNSNSFFMVLERFLLTIANFFVFTAIARQLGADQLGVFSLVQAILLVGHPVALFVNEQLLIRYTLDKNLEVNTTFKHAIVLKMSIAVLVYFTTTLLTFYFYGKTVASFTALLCLIHFFNVDLIFFAFFAPTKIAN